MRKILLLSFFLQTFLFSCVTAQTYTTGAANWSNTWAQNAGSFDFANGVGVFSFGSATNDGAAYGRFITTDGTLGGTATTLNPGQRLTIRVAGQDASGRTGITNGGRIGFSLRTNSSLFFDNGTANVFNRYDASSILRVEFIGGSSTASYTSGAGTVTGNMPNFATFKSGVTYDVEVISDKEFNIVIGGTRNNVQTFANGGGSVRQISICNISSNMDGLFTNLAVSNIPINLTANTGETFTVNGTITNNGATANSVQKNGVGTVILTGNNTYTGTTTVNAGTLQVSKTGYTATITTTTVTMAFTSTPANGTYAILPGALTGSQTFSATGLAANQTASFNAATGVVTVGSITPASTTLSAFTTTYGTASAVQTVSITGTNLTGNIATSTAPTGYEVSSDGVTYAATATFPAAGGTLRIRLKSNANVTGTNYNSQVINLTNGSATATVTTAASGNAVSAAALTINGVTANNKDYDGNNTATLSGTPSYFGLQNGESFSVTGTVSATFNNASAANNKPVTVTGYTAPSSNYTLSQPSGLTANINKLAITVTPDAGQSKVFGNSDPVFTYTFAPALISPDVITGALGRNSGEAVGTYPYTIGSLTAGSNYQLSIGGSNTFAIIGLGQSTADFRSKQSGIFSSASTWEYNQGGGSWVNATQAPTSNNNVNIVHAVTLDQDFTVGASKNFVISTGGSFAVNPLKTFTVTGNADFAGQPVVFLSDATGTASLGQVNGTLSGATNVTVERYIRNNGFRSWRLLSVPVTSSQTIRQAWQEGDANPLPKQNNVAGYGTQITGVFTTQAAAAAAGFDSTSVQAGMLRWNGSAWSNITSTNQSINNFSSYFLYIRGDRSLTVTGSTSSSSATTLRTKGTVYTGDQVNTIGANAFALIPNLYPSAIDFTGLTRTGGVSNLFYIWDSKKLNGQSLGAYQTFSGTNGFLCLLSGGSYTLGQPNTTIESGQSFFVQSTTAGTLTLKESAKISGTNGSLGFRPSGPLSKIDTRLLNSNSEMLDANAVVFNAAYTKAVAEEDAPKLGNPGVNFAIESESKLLAVEGTQPVKDGDVIQYRMWNLDKGNYQLEIAAQNMAAGIEATLEDSYLKTATPVNMSSNTTVSFSVDQNAGSSAANRFRLVFGKVRPAAQTEATFTVAPNPIENGTMNIVFRNQKAGRYSVRLLSADGRTVLTRTLSHAGGNANQSINLPATITSGTYTVEITSAGSSRSTQTVLVNRK